ncbi:hypothetical protein [Rossellomorea sp. NPDC077527]|uniref:hypothetical protein n=1 Tax=Rossellomorea sp. NPDC077527 TaxID=3364510 RepID=UPI0037C8863C
MTFKQVGNSLIIGLISGAILGLFLKWMQAITEIKVYTLLLNVDFIPIFASKTLPEWLEFMFHLSISCVIGMVFVYIMVKWNLSGKAAYTLSLMLTLPTVFLYFPLSYLAIKDVPGILNCTAILIWIAGHVLYALSLPLLYKSVTGVK